MLIYARVFDLCASLFVALFVIGIVSVLVTASAMVIVIVVVVLSMLLFCFVVALCCVVLRCDVFWCAWLCMFMVMDLFMDLCKLLFSFRFVVFKFLCVLLFCLHVCPCACCTLYCV